MNQFTLGCLCNQWSKRATPWEWFRSLVWSMNHCSRCLSLLTDCRGSLGQPGSCHRSCREMAKPAWGESGLACWIQWETALFVCRTVSVHGNKLLPASLLSSEQPKLCCPNWNWSSGEKWLCLQGWSLELQNHSSLAGHVKNQSPRKENSVVYACTGLWVSSRDREPFTYSLHKTPREERRGAGFYADHFKMQASAFRMFLDLLREKKIVLF